MTLISLSGVGVQYGATTILRDVTATIGEGERWGVIGRNGSGKTSLFRIIMGEQKPTSGSVARRPGLRFAVLDQHRDFADAATVWDAVAEAFRWLIDLEQDLARQTDALTEAGEHTTEEQITQYAQDMERFEHGGGYTYAARVDEVLEGLGFPAADARSMLVTQLSGGERGRVALARQLAVPADVLLLDEPTNHLDLDTTAWLEDYLRNSRETQLIISHDRAFLARVADHVLHLEDESAQAYSGGYATFVEQRAERRLAVQREFDKQRKSVAREEDYIRRNIAGQNSKQAKGRRKRLAWLPRLSAPVGDASTMAVRFKPGSRGGDQVLVAERTKIAIGERVLLKPFSGFIRRGDVVGLLGPNGAGKSTLLKAILGEKSLSAGELRVGGAISIGSYRQDFANVPREFAIYDIIAGLRPMWERGMVMGHLGRVQFSGDEVRRQASSLSGGELARVALAMMMLEGANFLIFDEPTNHLDVESIEALEDAILDFEGTVLLVSHDRELLRKLVTRVWELRDGHLDVFDGPFEEWEERRADATVRAEELAAEKATLEREKNRRKATTRDANVQRAALSAKERQRLVDRAERRVEELESETQRLTSALEDPSLYETPDGVAKAHALSKSLETQRVELARAVEEWETAMQSTESS